MKHESFRTNKQSKNRQKQSVWTCVSSTTKHMLHHVKGITFWVLMMSVSFCLRVTNILLNSKPSPWKMKRLCVSIFLFVCKHVNTLSCQQTFHRWFCLTVFQTQYLSALFKKLNVSPYLWQSEIYQNALFHFQEMHFEDQLVITTVHCRYSWLKK